MRQLTEDDVTFRINVEPEDLPVRGNYMDTGDPDLDRKAEDEAIARLERGDIEAWCWIEVIAEWQGFTGRDSLGRNSFGEGYTVADAVREYGMKANALADLNAQIADTDRKLEALRGSE